MAAAVAVTWGTAWLQFLMCFGGPGGVKIDPQMVPGGGQNRALEGPWRLLEASWHLWRGPWRCCWHPGALQEPACRRPGPKWVPLGVPFGVTFWVIFGDRVLDTFFVICLLIWGCVSGSFFESFGAEETAAHQMVQHAKCIENL